MASLTSYLWCALRPFSEREGTPGTPSARHKNMKYWSTPFYNKKKINDTDFKGTFFIEAIHNDSSSLPWNDSSTASILSCLLAFSFKLETFPTSSIVNRPPSQQECQRLFLQLKRLNIPQSNRFSSCDNPTLARILLFIALLVGVNGATVLAIGTRSQEFIARIKTIFQAHNQTDWAAK